MTMATTVGESTHTVQVTATVNGGIISSENAQPP